MTRAFLFLLVFVSLSACATSDRAPEPDVPPAEGATPERAAAETEPDPEPAGDEWEVAFEPGKKELVKFRTADGSTDLWFGLRFQLRYENLQDRPLDPGDQPAFQHRGVTLNRGRLKLGGNLFAPWLEIYSEFDFVHGFFLDYRATAEVDERLHIRVGQWKADYDRERIDSSGSQQLVDRSIVTYWFTIDRQLGASLSGRLGAEGDWDSSYWVEFLSGQGRGDSFKSGEWMLMARYQWNPFKTVLPFSQSDLDRREAPAASLSLAGATARTPYTRFSGDGGGQLPGFEEGRYRLSQLQQGSAYQHRGFSWQQELHVKRIEDEDRRETTRLWGGYAQAGYFLSESVDWWPEPLELALRIAYVDPDTSSSDDFQTEITLGANWFFSGHLNKLTLGVGRLVLGDPNERIRETLIQIQWDVSF